MTNPSAPSSRGDDDEPRRDEGSEEREAVVARELPPDTCSRILHEEPGRAARAARKSCSQRKYVT